MRRCFIHRKFFSILLLCFCCPGIFASGQDYYAPMFPFLPSHNRPDNITNVRTWTGADTLSAGADGFITARGDVFVDGNGRSRRFLGTNMGMDGCFPSHEDSENVARELSRYGINIVRLNYAGHKTPEGGYPVKDSFIEPEQLERFDYFFAKLKEQGIYVYFQLNISRKFGYPNGITNAKLLPKFKSGIDNADSRMIELQKKFHQEILEHVNPYTGLAYKDEPAIGMFELANENSIVDVWFTENKKFAYLPQPYKSNMISLWNDYLMRKYGNTDALKKVWGKSAEGSGEELLPEGIMDAIDQCPWEIQPVRKCNASLEYVKAEKKDKITGKFYTELYVENPEGSKTTPRLFWRGITLEAGKPYCLTMKMRSSDPAKITVRFGQASAPYKFGGLVSTVHTKEKWQEFKFNFSSPISWNDMRLSFSGLLSGTVDIADISLKSGMEWSLPSDQSIESRNISWPYPHDYYAPYQKALDFTEFLLFTENGYFLDLYNNVRRIGARQNITGTQLAYGFNLPQAQMDYCDIHGYWCRPVFSDGKWSRNNWYMLNSSIVNTKGRYDCSHPAQTITDIANTRIFGKPFTVSEYDHPNLNSYSAEGNVILSAMGAFQNWSALMQFAWIQGSDFDRDCLYPMYDMCTAPQKLAHLPACYAMFVRGDVRKGSNRLIFSKPSSVVSDVEAVTRERDAKAYTAIDSKLLSALPLAVPSGRELQDGSGLAANGKMTILRDEKDVPEGIVQAYDNRLMKSSTGELTWDWQDEKAGVFMVDTRNTKVFTGFVKGRTFIFRGMTLIPGKTRLDWMTLSLTLAEPFGNPRPGNVLRPGRYLLAATGVVRNTDEHVVAIKRKPGHVSCGDKFGGSPGTAPVLCEGIPAEISFVGIGSKVECFALDPDGWRTKEVPVTVNASGEAVLNIDPSYKTIWYELIINE